MSNILMTDRCAKCNHTANEHSPGQGSCRRRLCVCRYFVQEVEPTFEPPSAVREAPSLPDRRQVFWDN